MITSAESRLGRNGPRTKRWYGDQETRLLDGRVDFKYSLSDWQIQALFQPPLPPDIGKSYFPVDDLPQEEDTAMTEAASESQSEPLSENLPRPYPAPSPRAVVIDSSVEG